MDASGQTVCLCMIVKDEAHVIERCLSSVMPIVDYWVIVDTGSSDGTQKKILDFLQNAPGELLQRPWRNFAFNRSEALRVAQTHGDYSLIIDADDQLSLPENFELPALTADSYSVDIFHNDVRYRRIQILKNSLDWRYKGVVHEFPECQDAETCEHLQIRMIASHDGARSRNSSTYKKDAKTLSVALKTEQDPFLIARYTFYLAQSYFDAGELESSIEYYVKRISQGFWEDEIYYSLFQIGTAKERLKSELDIVVQAYMIASEMSPSRAEPLHAASRACRLAGQFERGYAIAERGLNLQAPAGGLFVVQSVYDYCILDEYAVCAYWTGRYRICLDATLRALESGKVPASEQSRMLQNMRFAIEKL